MKFTFHINDFTITDKPHTYVNTVIRAEGETVEGAYNKIKDQIKPGYKLLCWYSDGEESEQ